MKEENQSQEIKKSEEERPIHVREHREFRVQFRDADEVSDEDGARCGAIALP